MKAVLVVVLGSLLLAGAAWGDTKTVWYCPKCESTNIETVYLNRPSKANEVKRSIDEGPKPYVTTRYAVMTYEKIRMRCKACGYFVEHSIPDMR